MSSSASNAVAGRPKRAAKVRFGLNELDLERGINHVSFSTEKLARLVVFFAYSNSARILPVIANRICHALDHVQCTGNDHPNHVQSKSYNNYNRPKFMAEVDNGDNFVVVHIHPVFMTYKNFHGHDITNNVDLTVIEGLVQEELNALDVFSKAL